jgi:hypothetical protein
MEPNFFQRQINRLTEQFGKGAYGTERAHIIWKAVKDLPDAWMEGVVDRFIGESRHAPLLPEFREEIAKERERNRSRERNSPKYDWSAFASCSYCYGTGTFLALHREHAGFWAFRCHCEHGMRDPRQLIPQFKAEHAKDFVWMDGKPFLAGRPA